MCLLIGNSESDRRRVPWSFIPSPQFHLIFPGNPDGAYDFWNLYLDSLEKAFLGWTLAFNKSGVFAMLDENNMAKLACDMDPGDYCPGFLHCWDHSHSACTPKHERHPYHPPHPSGILVAAWEYAPMENTQ